MKKKINKKVILKSHLQREEYRRLKIFKIDYNIKAKKYSRFKFFCQN